MKVRLKSTNKLLGLGAKFCNIIHPLCKLPDNNFGIGNIIASGCIFEIGTTLAVIIFLFNKTSGANFNPAVTLAMTLADKQKTSMFLPYVAMQLLGASTALFISKHI